MTAAYRLKGLGWFGGVAIVSLGFYLVSLQVAAERKHLDLVNAKIGSAERDIRALETEFDVRANLAQLERWNGDTLSLVAPTARQFVRDEAQLAAISFAPGLVGDEVQSAALIVPALPAFAPPPVVDAPVFVPATVVQVAAVAPKPPAPRPARTDPAVTRMVKAVANAETKTPLATPSRRKAEAVAMLDSTLLSDTTLGDLMSGARAERKRLR